MAGPRTVEGVMRMLAKKSRRVNNVKTRVRRTAKPTNVILVNNGGVAHITSGPKTVRKSTRKALANLRPRTYGPEFIGPLRPQNVRRNRKVRSNKGGYRGGSMGANLRRLFS